MPIDTLPPDPTPSGGTEVREDRRRPGRFVIGNPHLIALLRARRPDAKLPEPAFPEPPPQHWVPDDPDDLAAAQGIAVSTVLGGLLWVGAIAAIVVVIGVYGRF